MHDASPGTRPRSPFAQAAIACAAAAWLAFVAVGFGSLFGHASTPGAAPAPPARWPSPSPCERAANMPSLLMFVHPGCPCTLASLGELERVMAKCAGRVAATVLFRHDPANGLDATASPAWRVVERIPGTQARIDAGDAAARAFGVTTSGSVVLYAPDGRLLFHGGITGSRGHEGDNAGACAVVAGINDVNAAAAAAAVFGCELTAPPGSPPR